MNINKASTGRRKLMNFKGVGYNHRYYILISML